MNNQCNVIAVSGRRGRVSSYMVLVGFLASALLASTLPAAAATPPAFAVEAKAALLVDASSGTVLYSNNMDAPFTPASLTKLMTLYLAFQAVHAGRVKLGDKVPITKDAWAQNPAFQGASLMFLKPGDDVTVLQIMQGIAVASGNDAAVAMAEFLGGSVPSFVNTMNTEARALGMTHTHFVDPNGLSPANVSTADDLMRLAQAYVHDAPEALQEVDGLPSITYAGITQRNYNWLIGYYQGADGLKTGFLPEVGYNQISTAKRGNMRLIGVVLGAATELGRRDQSAALLNYGYNNFSDTNAASRASSQGSVHVWKGKVGAVAAVPAEDVWVTIPKGSEGQLAISRSLPESVLAPVAADDKLGTLTVTLNGKPVRTVALVAQTPVPQGGLLRRLWDGLRLFFSGLFHRGTPSSGSPLLPPKG